VFEQCLADGEAVLSSGTLEPQDIERRTARP
jgi:hypothetical protein